MRQGAKQNRFLFRMVRILVGTLVAVSSGRLSPDSMPEIIAARSQDPRETTDSSKLVV
jgi:tRNA U38,U39,U40 pseudouridine synthase TruA